MPLRRTRRRRRTTTPAAFEPAAAKAKEEKERIAPEAREAERARRRGIQSQAEQAARDQKFERYDVRRGEARRCAAGFFAREQIHTDEHVAVAVSELRAETRLAALEGRIKAPRPSCQSAYLCRISACVGLELTVRRQ